MSLQRASILVSLASIFVYVISFVNQLLIARTFGAGVRMDAYLAGSNIPLIVNNLVGAVFVYAVVPHLVHDAVQIEAAKPRLQGLLVGCVGLAIVTLGIGFVAHVLPLGASTQFGDFQREAMWAAALSWGSCALFFLTALSDAVFNASKRFLFPVLAYLPAYLFTAIACYFLGAKYGGPALAGATLVGYVLVLPVRAFLQEKAFEGKADFSLFREFLKRMPLTALAVMSLYAFPVVDTYFGPKTELGALSILGYSTRIVSTLAVIVALGPFGVLIPELAGHSASSNREHFAHRSATLFRYALTLLVPVAIWITIFRLPIIVLLLQRGEFGPAASQDLANLLLYNVPGSIFMVLSMLVVRVFLADNRVKEAAGLSATNLLMYFAFCALLTPKFGLTGFGYAFVLAWTIHTLIALWVLFSKDKLHFDWKRNTPFAAKLLVSSAVIAGLAIVSRDFLHPEGTAQSLLLLMSSFILCVLSYLAVGKLLHSHEHQRLWGMVARLLRRSRSA